jgi:hypothetical protein
MLFKNSVRTSKRTPDFTITKINWLTLFKFKEQDFQVCFKLKLNTEAGSLCKVIFDMLSLQLFPESKNMQQKNKPSLSFK